MLRQQHTSAGRRAVARAQRVRHRQRVRDDEDRLLRTVEQRTERLRVALDDREPALAARLRNRRGRCAGGPRAVALERSPFVRPVERVVQARFDEARHVTAGESDLGRLARTLELARHTKIQRLVEKLLSEPARLRQPAGRQADRDRDVAVQEPLRRVLALAVAREDRAPHQKRTER